LVKNLDGSPRAKKRLGVIIETLSGERSVSSACDELGISEAGFHKLRSRWLKEALESLEPRAVGRPAMETSPQEELTAELQERVALLERELKAAQVREELAVALPYLARNRRDEKKTRP
jgi:transposase-like protein